MPSVTLIASTNVSTDALMDLGYSRHSATAEDETGWLEPMTMWCESDSDELAEFAGRTCYLSYDRPNPKTASNADYLANIIRQGHESVLAHASATFLIECSRACAHEIIRSRFLAFSEVSQRYVKMAPLKFEIPPALQENMTPEIEYWLKYSRMGAETSYEMLLTALEREGVTGKKAREAARSVLPLGTKTRMVVTGNIRAWRDFIRQRNSAAADAEIREVAQRILTDLRVIAPNSLQDL